MKKFKQLYEWVGTGFIGIVLVVLISLGILAVVAIPTGIIVYVVWNIVLTWLFSLEPLSVWHAYFIGLGLALLGGLFKGGD